MYVTLHEFDRVQRKHCASTESVASFVNAGIVENGMRRPFIVLHEVVPETHNFASAPFTKQWLCHLGQGGHQLLSMDPKQLIQHPLSKAVVLFNILTWSGPACTTACRISCGRKHGISTSSISWESATSEERAWERQRFDVCSPPNPFWVSRI